MPLIFKGYLIFIISFQGVWHPFFLQPFLTLPVEKGHDIKGKRDGSHQEVNQVLSWDQHFSLSSSLFPLYSILLRKHHPKKFSTFCWCTTCLNVLCFLVVKTSFCVEHYRLFCVKISVFKSVHLAPTTIKIIEITLFPVSMPDVNIHWRFWPVFAWFYKLYCCHGIGWLDNCMNGHVYRCSFYRRKVYDEWTFILYKPERVWSV